MRLCEVQWDVAMADKVQRTVEEATGRPCPCHACPFLPQQIVLVPRVRETPAAS